MASIPTATKEQWELHTKQQDLLQEEVESQPLIGALELGFDSLKKQYKDGSGGFVQGLQTLEKHTYRGFRRIRGDGNCFFRGFMFRLAESLVMKPNEPERKRIASFMQESLNYLVGAGYEAVGVQDFQEMVTEFFDKDILQLKTSEDVVKLFSNKGESEHIVWFARALCAAYMKLNSERFLPFLSEEFVTIEDYCAREVEPQGRECEQLHIIALSEILQIRVSIEYISAATENRVDLGPDTAALTVSFLYRPGHYDVLYPAD